MNTLREALDEYLGMRRYLGFKLQQAGRALFDFVTFMEQRQAQFITQALALAWAQQPRNVTTGNMGSATGQRTRLRAASPGNRSTHGGPIPRLAPVSTQAGNTVSVLR